MSLKARLNPTYVDPLRDLTSPSVQERLKIYWGLILSGFTKSSQDRVFALGVLGIMLLTEDGVRRHSSHMWWGVVLTIR